MDCAGWGHPAFTGSCQFPVASSQVPAWSGVFATPEALKRVARGREAHPGKRREGSSTLEGLQQEAEIFAPPSGCELLHTQDPG
jgi:hypothetical protein